MLTIGILLTDDLRDELASSFGCYSEMFKVFLDNQGLAFRVYDVRREEYPNDMDDCDGYLITGSRHGVYEDLPWLETLFDFIRRAHRVQKPLVGICFGHQAIAHALGGRVEKSDKGWGTSWQEWDITQPAPWMDADVSSLRLLTMFQDQVVALPSAAVRIATSSFCENGAFFIDRHVFCIQGHPEFTADYMRALMPYRQDDISDAQMQTALADASRENDNDLCGRWIARFFQEASAR